MPVPRPQFPEPLQHQPYYCEENAYHLARQLLDVQPAYVVFVTNRSQSVLMAYQRASREPLGMGAKVVWDYHVFVVARGFVYDPDSYLCQGNFPDELGQMRGRKSVPIREYLEASFPPPSTPGDLAGTKDLDANSSILTLIHFLPSFRLVPAADFLEHFASDRRDMLLEGQQDGEGRRWARPPPSWLPIRGGRAAEEHNLERWYNLDFHSEGYGVVLGGCDHLLAALFPHVLFACREL